MSNHYNDISDFNGNYNSSIHNKNIYEYIKTLNKD